MGQAPDDSDIQLDPHLLVETEPHCGLSSSVRPCSLQLRYGFEVPKLTSEILTTLEDPEVHVAIGECHKLGLLVSPQQNQLFSVWEKLP